jgi:methylated-DNA-[protein]-cysteine S-methyltransferase
MYARCTIDSPVGPLTLGATDDAIIELSFGKGGERPVRGPVLEEAARQLDAYFRGERFTFELPLKPLGTAFRQRVWHAMQQIPFGQTRSYGELARDLDSAPRAIGGACGANPIAIIVPCHRVVAAGGAIGGFSGGTGCGTKRQLLAHETPGLWSAFEQAQSA